MEKVIFYVHIAFELALLFCCLAYFVYMLVQLSKFRKKNSKGQNKYYRLKSKNNNKNVVVNNFLGMVTRLSIFGPSVVIVWMLITSCLIMVMTSEYSIFKGEDIANYVSLVCQLVISVFVGLIFEKCYERVGSKGVLKFFSACIFLILGTSYVLKAVFYGWHKSYNLLSKNHHHYKMAYYVLMGTTCYYNSVYFITYKNRKFTIGNFLKFLFFLQGNRLFYTKMENLIQHRYLLNDFSFASDKTLNRLNVKNTRTNLLWLMIGSQKWAFTLITVMLFLNVGLEVFKPLVLKLVLTEFNKKEFDLALFGRYSALLVAFNVAGSFLFMHYNFQKERLMIKVKNSLIYQLYLFTISKNSEQATSKTESLINFFSVDIDRAAQNIESFISIFAYFTKFALGTYLLYREIGSSIFAFGLFVLLNVVYTILVTKTLFFVNKKYLKYKDLRMKHCANYANNFSSVKMNRYEDMMMDQIEQSRRLEFKMLKFKKYLDALFVVNWCTGTTLVYVFTFSYTLLFDNGKQLDLASVLTSFALMNTSIFPLNVLNYTIASFSENFVNINRLSSYFQKCNVTEGKKHYATNKKVPHKPNIELKIKQAFYESSERVLFRNLSTTFEVNKKYVVNGKSNAGKTTLLLTLLNDRQFCRENFSLNVEYADENYFTRRKIFFKPQDSWVIMDTIRENIVLNNKFDYERYKLVLYVCCLDKDLSSMPLKDKTVLSQDGNNISTGQKARICLARTLYRQDTEVFLLDDPLTNVDKNVARTILHRMNKHYFAKLKNYILICTNIDKTLTSYFDVLLSVKGNSVEEAITNNIKHSSNYNELEFESDEEIYYYDESDSESGHKLQNDQKKLPNSRFNNLFEKNKDQKELLFSKYNKLSTYVNFLRYISDSKCSTIASLVFFFCIGAMMQFSFQFNDYYISTKMDALKVFSGNLSASVFKQLRMEIFYGFLLLLLAVAVLAVMRAFYFAYIHLRISQNIFKDFTEKIFANSPVMFEGGKYTSGDIMNHYSDDIKSTDNEISAIMNHLVGTIFLFLGWFIVNSMAAPFVLILIVAVSVASFAIQHVYRNVSNIIKKLHMEDKTPIINCLLECQTIEDEKTDKTLVSNSFFVTNVKLLGLKNYMLMRFKEKLQYMSSSAYTLCYAFKWLECMSQLLSASVLCAILTFAGICKVNDAIKMKKINESMVNLAITYALTITSTLSLLTRNFASVDQEMIGFVRLEKWLYPEEKKDEPPPPLPLFDFDSVKNDRNCIEFERVHFSYEKEQDSIYKEGLTFSVKKGEKCGIYGRTGKGKSTIFKLILKYITPKSGEIRLKTNRVYCVPVKPLIFSNKSVRFNVDPYNRHSEEEIFRAFSSFKLLRIFKVITSINDLVIDQDITLSNNEKQILCLVRAYLQEFDILLLDEAISSLDDELNEEMWRLICDNFYRKNPDLVIMSINHNEMHKHRYDQIIYLE